MKDDILDDDHGFDLDAKLVKLASFDFEHEAYLCKVRLETEHIKCALMNTNMTSMLSAASLSHGGIQIIVKEVDLAKAQLILEEIEQNKSEELDEDFRNADKEDIFYQKAIQENEVSFPKWLWVFVFMIIALAIFQVMRFSDY